MSVLADRAGWSKFGLDVFMCKTQAERSKSLCISRVQNSRHTFRAMNMAGRERSPRRSVTELWVRVKDGNCIPISLSSLDEPKHVYRLLVAVKKALKRLSTVDDDQIYLFENAEKQMRV